MWAGINRVTSLILFAVLVSCSHGDLREDPVIPAIKVNYPTLEFQACGETFHGLGICYLERGSAHNEVNLKIQGYYKGTIRVYSSACGLDMTFTYAENELMKIKLPKLEPGRSCLVTAVMSPEYPKKASKDVATYSFKGHLAIRIEKPEEIWYGETRKVTGNWRSQYDLMVGNFPKALVAIRGCGKAYNKKMTLDQGYARIKLSEAAERLEMGDCVAEGVALVKNETDTTFSILLTQYATELPDDPQWKDYAFSPLAIPRVEFSGGEIKVVASPEVSIISLNGEYEINNKAEFKFDRTKPNILRILTVKGRSVLGLWSAGAQEFEWKQ